MGITALFASLDTTTTGSIVAISYGSPVVMREFTIMYVLLTSEEPICSLFDKFIGRFGEFLLSSETFLAGNLTQVRIRKRRDPDLYTAAFEIEFQMERDCPIYYACGGLPKLVLPQLFAIHHHRLSYHANQSSIRINGRAL